MRLSRIPLFAAALLVGATLSTPAGAGPPSVPSPSTGLSVSPSTSPSVGPSAGLRRASNLVVESATELGPITQNPHNAARDNGQSVRYGNQSVWFFDDTILKDPDGFLTSTAATTGDLDASDNITMTSANPFDEHSTGVPPEFVPFSAAELAFQQQHASADCTNSADEYCGTVFAHWPGPAVVDQARHRILVSYGKLCRGGRPGTPCESGFVGQAQGTGLVSVDMDSKTVTRLTAINRPADIPSPEGTDNTLFFPVGQDWGGQAMVLVGDTLYGYGKCTLDGCAVAKVPIGNVTDISQWRYYTGADSNGNPQWSTDPNTAVQVKANGAAGSTVYWDSALGAYVNTFMQFLAQDVMYQTAPQPWGPWSTPTKLFTAAKTSGTEYAAFAHPEYTSADGLTKYFTYYTSSTGAQMLVKVRFARAPKAR
ncbi:uncharacterized protein DUF4185 [Kribbella sp. VKM Ac-2571]|uniref:DUF4185 domain-containing protein n=1 Tax=Kribbella sp. VKM Ac-2571 TaxID=2512222 RepID=UPI00105BE17F|nr:DUF4185 domain-containing protein [Kribbella sp. VKM Ac-2571]TDO68724.1 uncharacterized protein DUF4185 [Kribbella sp. VKM Ac-2571]